MTRCLLPPLSVTAHTKCTQASEHSCVWTLRDRPTQPPHAGKDAISSVVVVALFLREILLLSIGTVRQSSAHARILPNMLVCLLVCVC